MTVKTEKSTISVLEAHAQEEGCSLLTHTKHIQKNLLFPLKRCCQNGLQTYRILDITVVTLQTYRILDITVVTLQTYRILDITVVTLQTYRILDITMVTLQTYIILDITVVTLQTYIILDITVVTLQTYRILDITVVTLQTYRILDITVVTLQTYRILYITVVTLQTYRILDITVVILHGGQSTNFRHTSHVCMNSFLQKGLQTGIFAGVSLCGKIGRSRYFHEKCYVQRPETYLLESSILIQGWATSGFFRNSGFFFLPPWKKKP